MRMNSTTLFWNSGSCPSIAESSQRMAMPIPVLS